ncbi:VOC family protein [Streptomyces bambusae]|uniref:VOC family protein n=1 Tax=Streptomyces bambusae TaxID=1550616 RepID=UPI001CFC7095|nr:VOC family protein [Streptomyces bambusae]MCB5168656.1 VOC family protein [Streptomyces bambusae]
MLSTDFTTGSPAWLDLGSPDVDASAAFYRAVFGWEAVSSGPEGGDYRFFRKGGRTVAAVGPLTEEGAKPAWTVYFGSPDVQATTQAVRDGGGRVRVEPMDVMGEGWFAQYTDPDGADFAVWQAGKTAGLERTSEDDTLVWVELMASDPEASTAFYRSLFGWRHADMDVPGGMTYRVLSTADGDQEDASFGGVAPDDIGGDNAPHRWIPYFAVADADETVARTEGAGGSVLMPAATMEGVGRMAWLLDPAGAPFAILKPEPPAA